MPAMVGTCINNFKRSKVAKGNSLRLKGVWFFIFLVVVKVYFDYTKDFMTLKIKHFYNHSSIAILITRASYLSFYNIFNSVTFLVSDTSKGVTWKKPAVLLVLAEEEDFFNKEW
jgi:hypothetical protein